MGRRSLEIGCLAFAWWRSGMPPRSTHREPREQRSSTLGPEPIQNHLVVTLKGGPTAVQAATRVYRQPASQAARQGPCRGGGAHLLAHASAGWREAQLGHPPRRQLVLKFGDGPWCCSSLQAPTASGTSALTDCSPGGARAAACSSPLTTRIVAGAGRRCGGAWEPQSATRNSILLENPPHRRCPG
jgi:hypothetical protein